MSTAAVTRTVDPWSDLDWIDARAPRTNHAFVALLSIAAIAIGWEWLVALIAAQLIVGVTFGRRFCLACYLYFAVIQPRVGEGRIEDARAPRFANLLGAAFTTLATAAFLAGVAGAGWALTGVVAILSAFSAVTGICVGCVIYARIWGCEDCRLPAGG
jgi:predicted small integral membrane protein